jgi:hypothetical protein
MKEREMSNINITKEAMKAETRLRNIRKHAQKAQLETALRWADKERGYLSTLAPEVRAVLKAAGVMAAEDYLDVTALCEDVDPEPIQETLS